MKKQIPLRVTFLLGALLALVTNSVRAAYWTGAAADNNFWTAGNWSGTPPTASGTTTESLFMTNAPGVTGATVDSDLNLADGVSITVVNSTLDLTSSTNALVAKAIAGISNNPVQLNVIQFINSTVTLQAVQAVSVSLLNSSALTLKGTGRSINSTLEPTSVTLGAGSSITFSAGTTDPDGSGTPATPRRSNGLSIFNAASLQSYAADALTAPLTDFSVTGSDTTPFGLLGGGDGVNGGPFTIAALPATLVVNSLESWDGVNNPRAAGGVTKSGAGTDLDPWTYTMPKGMKITSTGKINCWTPDPGGNQGQPIKFVIEGGDLQMDAGAILNIERYKVRTGRFGFTLDLSVTNSITGAGQIGPITDRDSCPRYLTIQNVKNVSLAKIDVHTENVNTGVSDSRDMSITASGAVVVSGIIDNSDQDGGGDGGWGVTIKANTTDVNNIDTRGMRNDPPGRAPYSGNVVLQALSPIGGYSTSDSVNNASTNKLTVRGSIRTYGVDARTVDGNVTLQSVVLQLVYGVIEIPPFGIKTLDVGVVRDAAVATDLFVDVSSSGQIVNNVVQWGGPWMAPAGSAPAFTTDPVIGANATALAAYSGTLAGTATDVDLDPLTYGKFSGPAWLQVAANGALSGTPALTDACTNTWQIWVTDGARFDVATLQIFVVAPPRWPGNASFTYDNAVQNTAYANTLATNVIYCGAATLTFSKSNGPAWLNVAADGTLSGTPDQTNVLNNVFTVRVSDGTTNVPATLNIFVNGSPKFTSTIITKATAFVSQGDYAVRSQTLAGSAIDPQDPPNPATLSWAYVSGPAWLTVAPDGSLSGTPSAGDIGFNTWTISAANAYPATTATLRMNVQASPGSGPIEVINREYWDGVANPHAADGVTLTGTGTTSDPATYTVPRGLLLYSSGQIYTSLATGQNTEDAGLALNIKFNIQGDLNMDANNNAFVTAVHSRNASSGQRLLILDLNGTNSIVGAGRIVGLGNRVDALIFPDCFDRDTPRILTISNVNNVKLFDINVQVRNANNWGRPLLIKANGTVEVTSGIDNSDRDTGGDGGNNVSVFAKEIKVNGIDTRSFRTANFRNVGNITLTALAAPGYNAGDGGNNALTNKTTVTATLRPTTPQTNTTWGTITCQSVILELGPSAILDSPAPGKTTLNVGVIGNGKTVGDLFVNNTVPFVSYSPAYVVNWFLPTILFGGAAPGEIVLSWSGSGYTLQQNPDVTNPLGWITAPSGTSNPATNTIDSGNLFYRLRWP